MNDQLGTCGHCGQALSAGVRFCEHCGRPVAPAPPPPPAPPSTPPSAGPSLLPLGLLGCFFVLLASSALAGGFWFARHRTVASRQVADQPIAAPAPSTAPAAPALAPPPTAVPVAEEEDQVADDEALGEADSYAPREGFEYTFYNEWPDGTKGETQVIVGRPRAEALATEVEVVPTEPGEPPVMFATHFFSGEKGLEISSSQEGERDLYLIDNPQVGRVWDTSSARVKVLKVGEPLDLEFVKFDHAVVVERHLPEVEWTEISWLVPRYGEVYVTLPGGQVVRKLIEVNALSPDKVRAIMDQALAEEEE